MAKRIKPNELGAEFMRIKEMLVVPEFEKVLQKITLDGFNYIVETSPLDTGFLRSKWMVTTQAAQNTIFENPYKSTGQRMINDATYYSMKIKIGSNIRIYNNTSYAKHVEKRYGLLMIEPTYMYVKGNLETLSGILSRKKIS